MFSQAHGQKKRRAPAGRVRCDVAVTAFVPTPECYHGDSCEKMTGMARLAWFSPMPPVKTGIAVYSAEVVQALRGDPLEDHLIDVYPERAAHDFIWRHLQQPYDLIVYQLGNSSYHDYIWPYLFRYPGLAVLHDGHLHHARAATLLRQGRADDYRTEFAANHPDLSVEAAELAVAGFDNHLYYSWPMTSLVIEASRATAVHAPILAEELRARHPSACVSTIRLSHGDAMSDDRVREARVRVRSRYGIRDDAVLFGVFGGLTPEKRIPQVLAALAATLSYLPHVRLLLAGAPASHYDVAQDVRNRRLEGAVTVAGYLERTDDFTDHLAACDVSLNLRWPTAREVSGPWLRALAAGRPTITMDLAHLADVPSLDPRTWRVAAGGAAHDAATPPVTVAVDVLDEDHSLRLAMRRLAMDADLRARLAAAARAYWEREHSPQQMTGDYQRVIAQAIQGPRVLRSSGPQVPAHLLDCADRKLHELLDPFGLRPDLWSNI